MVRLLTLFVSIKILLIHFCMYNYKLGVHFTLYNSMHFSNASITISIYLYVVRQVKFFVFIFIRFVSRTTCLIISRPMTRLTLKEIKIRKLMKIMKGFRFRLFENCVLPTSLRRDYVLNIF